MQHFATLFATVWASTLLVVQDTYYDGETLKSLRIRGADSAFDVPSMPTATVAEKTDLDMSLIPGGVK